MMRDLLIIAAIVGVTSVTTHFATLAGVKARMADEPLPEKAIIACPFPNSFSFLRGADDTVTVYCITEPADPIQVETNAQSTEAYHHE